MAADVRQLAEQLVARVGATDAGRRVGCSRQMMSAVASGTKAPGKALARAIRKHAAALPPEPEKKAPAAPAAAERAPAETTIAEVLATVAEIDATLADDVPATARASLFRARLAALAELAKLRGEYELTGAMIVRSRFWRDFRAHLRPVLEKHPEAAADFAAVFEALALEET